MKRILLTMALVMMLQFATAAVINEKTLAEAGYNEFSVQGADKNACTEIAFAKDLNQNTAEFFTVFSLHAAFLPIATEEAKASAFLNGDENALEAANATEFENGWYRFVLPREKLLPENKLKVCLKTSNTVVEARLLADSMIGTYKMPEFKKENFIQTVDNLEPTIGEEFEVTIRLTNTGSEATDINVLYIKPEFENSRIQVLRGQTAYFNIIRPGETITLKYSAKAKQATPLTLPGAAAYYTNIFGERKRIVSNYPMLNVVEPEIKVKALFLLKEAAKKVSETTSAQIAVKNEGRNTLYNIALYLELPQGINLVNGNSSETIASLKPKETKYFDLNISSAKAADYSLGCKLVYLDYNITETNCETARITFEERQIPMEIVFAVIIVLGALMVYAYFHFKK